jgi:hypothetical protein
MVQAIAVTDPVCQTVCGLATSPPPVVMLLAVSPRNALDTSVTGSAKPVRVLWVTRWKARRSAAA